MSHPTSGRISPVNGLQFTNPCKVSLPFQNGKHGSSAFDLCLKPRPIANTKSSLLAEAHLQPFLEGSGSCWEEHSIKPSGTGRRHHGSTTRCITAQPSSTSSQQCAHTHQAGSLPSARKGALVLLLPHLLFMTTWNAPHKNATFQKLHHGQCQLCLLPRTLSSKERTCPGAVKGEQKLL